MVDDVDAGRRPLVRAEAAGPGRTDPALAVCPGVGLSHNDLPPDSDPDLATAWGPVLEVWEGHAADSEIRFAASSGGAATALALHGLVEHDMYGVLHIAAREDVPYLNRTVLSTTRAELLAATGSRYAPASPCDRLDLVRDGPRPSVVIGKPCDIAALARIRTVDPDLDDKVGLTVAIFCAGTPTTRGTFEMLERMGIDPGQVDRVRYRGRGWPGAARAESDRGGETRIGELTYEESWGISSSAIASGAATCARTTRASSPTSPWEIRGTEKSMTTSRA